MKKKKTALKCGKEICYRPIFSSQNETNTTVTSVEKQQENSSAQM